jgi:hypothetical protein
MTHYLEHRLDDEMHDFTVSLNAKTVWHIVQGALARDRVIFDIIGFVINIAARFQSTHRKETLESTQARIS